MAARLLALAGILVLAALAAGPSVASGAPFTVTRLDDPVPDGCALGDCSLREAIIVANETPGADTITLGTGSYMLSLGELEITDALTLSGVASDSTYIDGGGLDRVLRVSADGVVIERLGVRNGSAFFGGGIYVAGEVTLREVGVTDSVAPGENGRGGGIYADHDHARLTLIDSIVSGNEALEGGGLYGGGQVVISGSWIVNNTSLISGGGMVFSGNSLSMRDTRVEQNEALSDGYGGGMFLQSPAGASYTIANSAIYDNAAAGDLSGGVHHQGSGAVHFTNVTFSGNDAGGASALTNTGLTSAFLTNVTIADNQSEEFGYALGNYGTLRLKNSIVVDSVQACVGDGTWDSDGHNIDNDTSCPLGEEGDMSGVNPDLSPLANNGGLTPTHVLNEGSPAIDNAADCPVNDQRGYARNVGPCDIGAFEYGSTNTALVWGDNNCSGLADAIDALLTLRYDAGLPADTGTCPPLGGPVVSGGPALTWGDVDCDGTVNSVDGLKLLRHDAGLSVQQEPACPMIGET